MGLGQVFDRFFGRRVRVAPTVGALSSTSESGPAPPGSSDKEGWRFMLRFMIADRPALVGLVLVAVFMVWATVEGILQEAATLLKQSPEGPNYGAILLPSNPIALNFNAK